MPAFCVTTHKAQGLTKQLVVYFANDKQFARALTYVALSRCTSLSGLYIVGAPVEHKHFKQTGVENDVIIRETERLRVFQHETLKKGYVASKLYWEKEAVSHDYQILYSVDEPEF